MPPTLERNGTTTCSAFLPSGMTPPGSSSARSSSSSLAAMMAVASGASFTSTSRQRRQHRHRRQPHRTRTPKAAGRDPQRHRPRCRATHDNGTVDAQQHRRRRRRVHAVAGQHRELRHAATRCRAKLDLVVEDLGDPSRPDRLRSSSTAASSAPWAPSASAPRRGRDPSYKFTVDLPGRRQARRRRPAATTPTRAPASRSLQLGVGQQLVMPGRSRPIGAHEPARWPPWPAAGSCALLLLLTSPRSR